MTPELMTLHLADGSTFTAEVNMEPDGLHVNAGFVKDIIQPDSVRQVCHRLLEMINDAQDPVGPVKR